MSQSQGTLAQTAAVELDAAAFGQRIMAGLPTLRPRSVSLHDERGDILWLSNGVMGPSEHAAVRSAIESFAGNTARARADFDLGDGHTAVLLRAMDGRGECTGFAALFVDAKRLKSKGRYAVDLPIPVLHTIREFGRKLALAAAAASTPRALHASLQPPSPRASAPPVDPALDAQCAALREFPLSLFVQHLTPLQPGTQIRRFEVLLRSTLPAGSDEAPRQLLQAAERQGLGSVIDRRVLNELVAWLGQNAAQWNSAPALFSVNLSTTSLYDEHFLKFVEQCLAKAELPRDLIGFEVDAQLCRRRPDHSLRLATGLARAGSGIILDDFSWYDDSLSLLRLPAVRLLKLDRALTVDLATDKIRQAAIAGIAQMARVAGVHTVAKRIDCAAERELLTALGVDFIQGFAFSAPTPLDASVLTNDLPVIVEPAAP